MRPSPASSTRATTARARTRSLVAAGVTWGTLQHQFGSRELLLLEVLNQRWHDLQNEMATAEVSGTTLEARLHSVLEVLATHYGEPAQLASLQILLDLSRDPEVSKATKRAIDEHGARLIEAWQPLFEQALGEAANDEILVRYAFATFARLSHRRSHRVEHHRHERRPGREGVAGAGGRVRDPSTGSRTGASPALMR